MRRTLALILKRTSMIVSLGALALGAACGTTGGAHGGGDAVKSGDVRVKRALDALDLKYEVDGDGDFKLGFALDGGRSQLLFVGSGSDMLGKMEIRNVWSYVYGYRGELTQEAAAWLLSRNDQVKLGSFGVVEMDDGTQAVTFVVKTDANGSAEELRAALIAVSSTADGAEKRFTGDADNF